MDRKQQEYRNPNHTVNSLDIIDIYITFHPTRAECIFFSSAHGTYPKKNFIMCHKANFKIFEEIEIIQSILSDNKAFELRNQ